jgi:hypothetical protein
MPTWAWIVIIVVAALIVLALIGAAAGRKRRTQQLREGFGPEYDRTVDESGGRRGAERELQQRQERRQQLDIRELAPAARERHLESWRTLQTRFVDDPGSSVRDADRLVQDVMRERGYPMDNFEQRAADVSVDHPHVVEHYRAAHRTWGANERGEATTEDLRQSVVHYRALFDELLGGAADEPVTRDTSDTGADERPSQAARGPGDTAEADAGHVARGPGDTAAQAEDVEARR